LAGFESCAIRLADHKEALQVSEPHAATAPHTYRLWAAFAVLPFVDALVGFVGFPLVWYMGGHDGRPADPEQAARSFALLSGFLGLVVTIGGAVPAVLWLRKRGPVSLWQLIAAGLILGNVPFLFYMIRFVLPAALTHLVAGTMSQHLVPVSDLLAGVLRVLAIGSVMGALSALVFWFLAIRRTVRGLPGILC
jgi:hypothetical protein